MRLDTKFATCVVFISLEGKEDRTTYFMNFWCIFEKVMIFMDLRYHQNQYKNP